MEGPKAQWLKLAHHLQHSLSGQESLLDDSPQEQVALQKAEVAPRSPKKQPEGQRHQLGGGEVEEARQGEPSTLATRFGGDLDCPSESAILSNLKIKRAGRRSSGNLRRAMKANTKCACCSRRESLEKPLKQETSDSGSLCHGSNPCEAASSGSSIYGPSSKT
jgi:hypothetical protein